MNGPGTVNNRTQVQVPLDQNETIYIDTVQPNVYNISVAILKTATTVDVEKFLGGIPNQSLKVQVDGAVTLKYNVGGMGSIITNTGADKLLFAGRVYDFTYINDNWYEKDDSVAGGGGGTTSFPLTINSSNTGAASPALFNGSVGVTISANTVGAPSLSGSYSDPAWITTLAWSKITGAPGFVVGPASATDNALARYDLTTGKLIQNSNAILEDNGVLKVAAGILVGTGTVSQNNVQDSNFASETLYIDSPNSRVGIGTDTPEATLSIHSQGTNDVRGVSGRHWDNTTAFSHFKYIGARARGNNGNPSAVLSQDSLVGFTARGYKATDWSSTVGGLYVYAEDNWTNTSTPISIRFLGVASGTTVTEWFKFNSLGVTRSVASNWSFTQTTNNDFVFSTNSVNRLTIGSTVSVNGAMSVSAGAATPGLTVTTTGLDTLRLAYDGSNTANFRVESNGRCVLSASGTSPSFFFASPMTSSLSATGNYTLDFVSTSSAGTSNALGLRMTASNASTTGTVSLRAMLASVSVTGAGGTTTDAIAMQTSVTRTNGTLTNGYGLYVDAISGTMTNAYGIRVFNITGGSTLNFAIHTGTGLVRFGDTVNIATTNGLQVNGTKVVGAQGATIADPAGGGTIDTEARTAINTIIDRLQAHGLIA